MGGMPDALLSNPITVGLVVLAICLCAGGYLALRGKRTGEGKSDPLDGFFTSQAFNQQLRLAGRRKSDLRPPLGINQTAMLRGRIDHLNQVRHIWGPETRAEAIEQVAQIMRAGVRKDDVITPVDDDGFVILAPGASERDAGIIAKRLREALSQKYLAGMGTGLHVTASFGVAECRDGESEAETRERADAALDAAQEAGEDQVITASEWEEVILLPAPDSGDQSPQDQGDVAAA